MLLLLSGCDFMQPSLGLSSVEVPCVVDGDKPSKPAGHLFVCRFSKAAHGFPSVALKQLAKIDDTLNSCDR